MKTLPPMCIILGLALVATSCVSYTGVSKAPGGELYISGATSYVIFSSPWIRRCDVVDTKLNCVELTEPPQSKGSTSGTSAPATSAAPEAPAPAPEPEAKPTG